MQLDAVKGQAVKEIGDVGELVSTPEEKCIGGPEQNYITDDGSQAPRTGRLAAGRSFVGRGFR